MITYILAFHSPEATLDTVGGKGANLAELTRAGFAVPPGFLITTDAYRAFVQANGIHERIVTLAKNVAPDDPVSLDNTSEQIRALFSQGAMPTDIGAEIEDHYLQLSKSPLATRHSPLAVAVRSSATAEDLPGLSFAGQQETYLNVIGTEAVRETVKKCWASLWTARAIGYRARNNIAPDDVALAVVIQQMIQAEVSGVLFTANPLTGRRDEVVIDASFGLGEAIVSGQVEPDHYVVTFAPSLRAEAASAAWRAAKQSARRAKEIASLSLAMTGEGEGRIIHRKLGAKAFTIVSRADGGTDTLSHTDANAQRQALSDEQILALASIGRRVAQHYSTPQDVEWAWAHGQFYILQARPITSLYPLPDLPYTPDDERIYFSFNVGQGMLDPITPLGISALRRFLSGFRFKRDARTLVPDAGGRLFIDITDLARDPRLRHLLLAFLARGDPASRATLQQLIETQRIRTQPSLKWWQMLALPWPARRFIFTMLRAMRKPDATAAQHLGQVAQFVAQSTQHAREASSLAALIECVESGLRGFVANVGRVMPVIAPAIGGMSIVDNWLVQWLGEPRNSALKLVRSLPHNVTTEMDLKLWALAQAIHADPASRDVLLNQSAEDITSAYRARTLPPIAQQALDTFLQEYGMRAVAEIDLGRPRWREDPSSILQTLRSYVQLAEMRAGGDTSVVAPDEQFRRGAVEAEQLAKEYVARVRRTRFGHIRAKMLRTFISRMRTLGGYRETPKFTIVKLLDAYRTAWLRQGDALVARGLLARADDVFFVPLDDWKKFAQDESLDLKSIVARNRAEYERERGRKQIPRLLMSTGEAFYEGLHEEGTNDLIGDGVSPGMAEGAVRVVRDPRGVRLEPGDILVCPATDPGWTPLFLAAGGLVMEVGGMVTHGSVVAREYGIPAVVGVHDATTRLKTGQRARVDGSAGRVTVVE